jgi:exodeoxyribonuclease V alpha subunit
MKWQPYLDAGLLLPLDLLFAERVLGGTTPENALAFLACLCAFSRQGHLALRIEEIPFPQLAEEVRTGARALPERCKPFVREMDGIFYLEKNWICEESIATDVLRLLRTPVSEIAVADCSVNSEQKQAICNALRYPLSILSGGPGTGKTYTAARLIQAFLESMPDPSVRVLIAAPTGKAAAHLEAHVRRLLPSETRIQSGTCHRLLQLTQERFTPREPLQADLILIDECSMIDAALFSQLLGAVLPASRLVLIGDPDQLPAVDAGSVFADLVQSGVCPCVQLTKTLRSDREDILQFAHAIRTGDTALVEELLRHKVQWTEELNCNQHFQERFSLFFEEEPDPEALLSGLDRCRLLSCMRQGPFGVDALNAHFKEELSKMASQHRYWAIPILIKKNAHSTGLYNGDTGFLVKCAQDYALFPDRAGSFRRIPALALPAYEWGYCLSVHKSQGSEYEEVVVLIPPGSEVFGREVLYTAATRCRRALTCAGSLGVIQKTVQNSARKISGLSARLKKI